MNYERIKNLKTSDFKRLCGVRPETFNQMVAVLKQESPQKGQRGGQPKLSVEDQLLMTLQYWREYRTYFHIGQSWDVHESTVSRIVHRLETLLTSSRRFKLPGKKQLTQPDYELDVIVIDVSETPIERPKKNKNATTAGRRNGTRLSLR